MSPGARLAVALLGSALCSVTACSRTGEGDGRATVDALAPTPSPRTASCDRITAASVCSEYSGANLAQNEALHSASCVRLGGTFTRAECPNTSVLGACTLSTAEVRKFYGGGGAAFDPARAETECTGSYRGTWAVLK